MMVRLCMLFIIVVLAAACSASHGRTISGIWLHHRVDKSKEDSFQYLNVLPDGKAAFVYSWKGSEPIAFCFDEMESPGMRPYMLIGKVLNEDRVIAVIDSWRDKGKGKLFGSIFMYKTDREEPYNSLPLSLDYVDAKNQKKETMGLLEGIEHDCW